MPDKPETLSCSFYAKIRKPIQVVFDAIYRADQLSGFFATGGATANLDPGTTVHWSFHDHPQFPPFPVQVIEVTPNQSIHLRWESGIDDGWNDVKITFEELEEPGCTLVRITESGWPRTDAGIANCVGNCGGWAHMLSCLKCYLEHGFNLREFMF